MIVCVCDGRVVVETNTDSRHISRDCVGVARAVDTTILVYIVYVLVYVVLLADDIYLISPMSTTTVVGDGDDSAVVMDSILHKWFTQDPTQYSPPISFSVTTSAIDIADPSYPPETWHAARHVPAHDGEWHARCLRLPNTGRNAILEAWHVSAFNISMRNMRLHELRCLSDHIGVDSGLCAIADSSRLSLWEPQHDIVVSSTAPDATQPQEGQVFAIRLPEGKERNVDMRDDSNNTVASAAVVGVCATSGVGDGMYDAWGIFATPNRAADVTANDMTQENRVVYICVDFYVAE